MAQQARAQATRQRILDAAVDVIGERGYGETGLNDIIERSGISKGAFYYHFTAKEDVAAAIIEVLGGHLIEHWAGFDPAAPALAQIIKSNFATLTLLLTDKYWQVGMDLYQSLGQVAADDGGITAYWADRFTFMMTAAREAGELRDDINPTDIAAMFLEALFGTHTVLLSTTENPFEVVERSWQFLLRSFVPAEKLSEYEQLCAALVVEHTERVAQLRAANG